MYYILNAIPLLALLFGIYLTSFYGYLLFHSLSETFSIVIACGIFMVVWNARKLLNNHYLLFVGIAYLYVGSIDFLHMLAFKGMGVFEGYGANLPTQLWVAGRYVEALSLLSATIFLYRRLSHLRAFAAYGIAVGLLLLSIFHWKVFPVCFVEGAGLTPFKIYSEYVICLILLAAIGLLILNSRYFDRKVLILLIASISTAIAQELAFTTYLSVYGLSNMVGHFLKIVSFYLLYKAIIETSLISPFDLLFRELKQSEAKFRSIFETNVVPIAYCDQDGRVLDANDDYLRLLGSTREELKAGAVRWDAATPPEWKHVDKKGLEHLMRDGVCPPLEKEYARKDGTRVPVLLGACRVAGSSGQVVAFALDITERKRVEAELRKVKERQELLATVAERLLRTENPQAIVEELCRMVMAHLDCQFFFNYLVQTVGQRLHLNACAGISAEAAAAIRQLDFGVAVCGCVARDGRRIVAEDIQHGDDPRTQLVKSYGVQAYCCHPLLAQGRLIGTLSFGTRTRSAFAPDEVALMKSVTDQVAVAMQRLHVEQALRESEEKLRSAFAKAAIGFAITSPNGRFVDANPAYCALTGYDIWELRTLEFPQLIHPDDFAENMKRIKRLLAGEITGFVVQNRYVRKGGGAVWVQKSVSLVRDAEGAARWIIALVEDITMRKQAEEAVREAHDQLQDHAGRLQETNKELESFAYTISHDLRAPLRAINGFSRILSEEFGPSLGEEGKRRLGVIETNAIKMGALIDDLLAFSRAGRTAMSTSKIDMNSLVADVVETLKASHADGKTDIHVDALAAAHGDPALIRQVLANLIENAMKFSRKKPEPRLEVGSFERNGDRVYFVKDNGVGFDMKYHDKLFGVFNRLVSEQEFEGTGVGMAIVQRLVSRHGGRVWAEAEPGEGATFFFTLKCKG
ncbi:MAG: hypothetical protein CVU79_12875 [Elusimicrobia bacterium HGW-Elusimicrobia-3]|nr:MAG: hypothetical protein CVU79_12875 [Elusimicrobia bacterium HGW-Elusimicrobia-3]